MELLDFIICEDIRTENNGKMMLIGMLHDGISLRPDAQFPVHLNLATYIRLRLAEQDQVPDQFEIRFLLDGETILSAPGRLEVSDRNKPILLALGAGVLPIHAPGVITFAIELRRNGEVLETLIPNYEIDVTVFRPATTHAARSPAQQIS